MKTKKPSHKLLSKSWLITIVTSAVVIPTIGYVWARMNQVWAAPQKIQTIEQAVVQNAQIQSDLKEMVQEQKERNDRQDSEIEKGKEISQLQIDSLKQIIGVLKK